MFAIANIVLLLASVMTLDYLRAEAGKGKRSDFEHYLSRVPNAPADANDEPVK